MDNLHNGVIKCVSLMIMLQLVNQANKINFVYNVTQIFSHQIFHLQEIGAQKITMFLLQAFGVT